MARQARDGWAWLGLSWMAWQAWFGWAGRVTSRQVPAWQARRGALGYRMVGAVWRGRLGRARHRLARFGSVGHGIACLGTVGRGTAGTVWYGGAWRDQARRVRAWRGGVWQARYGRRG